MSHAIHLCKTVMEVATHHPNNLYLSQKSSCQIKGSIGWRRVQFYRVKLGSCNSLKRYLQLPSRLFFAESAYPPTLGTDLLSTRLSHSTSWLVEPDWRINLGRGNKNHPITKMYVYKCQQVTRKVLRKKIKLRTQSAAVFFRFVIGVPTFIRGPSTTKPHPRNNQAASKLPQGSSKSHPVSIFPFLLPTILALYAPHRYPCPGVGVSPTGWRSSFCTGGTINYAEAVTRVLLGWAHLTPHAWQLWKNWQARTYASRNPQRWRSRCWPRKPITKKLVRS